MLIRVRRTRTHPAADWTSANPWLGPLEMGVEEEAPHKAKINFSDVRVRWNSLDYWNPSGVTDWTAALAAKVDGTAGVKVYRASVTQISTNAPASTVLENSLSGAPAWSYVSTGVYELTLASAWTANKVFVTIQNGTFNDVATDGVTKGWERTSANVLRFYGFDITGTAADWGMVTSGSLEILVYP